jgi:hypothetical protein
MQARLAQRKRVQALPEQEIVELGLPFAVETNDLAVEDDGVLQFGGEGFRECAEGLDLERSGLNLQSQFFIARAEIGNPNLGR